MLKPAKRRYEYRAIDEHGETHTTLSDRGNITHVSVCRRVEDGRVIRYWHKGKPLKVPVGFRNVAASVWDVKLYPLVKTDLYARKDETK